MVQVNSAKDPLMSLPQRASSTFSAEQNSHKRVCKACDRCRLKKSKCNGANPCSRCNADNAICVFGKREKTRNKVYPKGYVEMLEQQQLQLVSGLRKMYRRFQAGKSWPGEPLKESHDGFPLTHDILERLDVLHATDPLTTRDVFENDVDALQERCLRANGVAQNVCRESVISEELESSITSSNSSHGISSPARPFASPDSYSLQMTPFTLSLDTDFHCSSPNQKSQSAMPPSTPFNPTPAALLQHAWAGQQLSSDNSMDVDVSSYDPSMGCDPHIFSNPNPSPRREMDMCWEGPFEQLINPNALQTS